MKCNKQANLFNTPSPVLLTSYPQGTRKTTAVLFPMRGKVAEGRMRGKVNKAFTLIELLVVVLIIGILAAVALPQYKIAVEKTRLSRILSVIKAIDNAQQVYYLAHGDHAANFAELDVELPAGATSTTPTVVTYKDGFYKLYREGDAHNSTSYYDTTGKIERFEKYYDEDHIKCWHKGNAAQKKLCQSFAGSDCTLNSNNCHILP